MTTKQDRQIRIRCVVPGQPSTGNGIRYYVVQESDAAIHLDNRARDRRFASTVTLAKLPNGHFANSAGQEFEIVPCRACKAGLNERAYHDCTQEAK